MRRRRKAFTILAAVVVLAQSVEVLADAAATAGPLWSISFSGDLEGTATKVKPQCLTSEAGESAMFARASFKLGSRTLRISMYFAAPVEPGTRAFSATPGPSVVVLSISDPSNPAAQWVSAGVGTAVINDDRRSGSVQGSLIGARSQIEVEAGFDCSKVLFTGGGDPADASGEGGSDSVPSWSGSVEATVAGGECTGSESGTIYLYGLSRKRVFGVILTAGSYACAGVTVPTSGGMVLGGRLGQGTLRLRVEELVGLLLPTWNCLVSQTLEIRVRNDKGSATPQVTAPSGDIYKCTIEVEIVQ